jgi:hypothetical protein
MRWPQNSISARATRPSPSLTKVSRFSFYPKSAGKSGADDFARPAPGFNPAVAQAQSNLYIHLRFFGIPHIQSANKGALRFHSS